MSDTAALQMNRVQLGIAEAHGMLEMYSTHVVQGDRTCLLRIAEWKSVRNNQFYKPLPVLGKNSCNLIHSPFLHFWLSSCGICPLHFLKFYIVFTG